MATDINLFQFCQCPHSTSTPPTQRCCLCTRCSHILSVAPPTHPIPPTYCIQCHTRTHLHHHLRTGASFCSTCLLTRCLRLRGAATRRRTRLRQLPSLSTSTMHVNQRTLGHVTAHQTPIPNLSIAHFQGPPAITRPQHLLNVRGCHLTRLNYHGIRLYIRRRPPCPRLQPLPHPLPTDSHTIHTLHHHAIYHHLLFDHNALQQADPTRFVDSLSPSTRLFNCFIEDVLVNMASVHIPHVHIYPVHRYSHIIPQLRFAPPTPPTQPHCMYIFLFAHTTWQDSKRPPHAIIVHQSTQTPSQWHTTTILLIPPTPPPARHHKWHRPELAARRLRHSFCRIQHLQILPPSTSLDLSNQHHICPFYKLPYTHNSHRQFLYALIILYITYPIQPPPPNWDTPLIYNLPKHKLKRRLQMLLIQTVLDHWACLPPTIMWT